VRLRRLVAAAATYVVAIVLAICVPFSQLQTIAEQIECCCPDPEQCKCPDHNPDEGTQSKMQACHKTQQTFVAPAFPAFVAPAVAAVARPDPVAVAPPPALPVPHPSPPPRRPDAPS
jgi:hypothetical protein